MNIIVWSTESVDTSAMLLSHFLGGTFTKSLTLEVRNILSSEEDSAVLFYGQVSLEEDEEEFVYSNATKIYHSPEALGYISKKNQVNTLLQENGLHVLKLQRRRDNWTTFEDLRSRIVGDKVSLFHKKASNQIATVSNQAELDKYIQEATHFSESVTITSAIRGFIGNPISAKTDEGFICAQRSVLRELSFVELLTKSAPEDIKMYITSLFDSGYLKEEMAEHIDLKGWIDEKLLTYTDTEQPDTAALIGICKKVSSCLYGHILQLYGQNLLDFAAVDMVYDSISNEYKIWRMIGSPSLQNNEVLNIAGEYLQFLIENGRSITKDTIKTMVDGLNQEDLVQAFKALHKLAA